jgi:hypothetical protein
VNVVGSGISIGIGASVYSPADSQLVLGTNSTERVRIDNVGSAQFQGQDAPSGLDTRISRYGSLLVATSGELLSNARCSIDSGNGNITTIGDLILSDGKGIDFSATSDGSGTATSEVLDDYEEGYFTPTVVMTTSGSITLKAAFTELSYIKIGKLVTIVGQLRIDSVSSPVGNISITNLPFTVRANTDLGRAGTAMYYYDASGGANNITKVMPMKVTENSTEFDVLIKDTDGGITPGGNDELAFSFSYVAA